MGDFNINWEDKSTRKNLKQITDSFDLKQLISGPTRITNSTKSQIDLIFTNRPERILKSCNMLTGLSDHNMILVTRKLTKKRFSSFVKKCEFFGIPKNKQENFKGAIQQIEWDNLLLGIDYEEDSEIFTKRLENIITDYTCKFNHRKKKNMVPWINVDILNLMKERDHALKTSLKTKLSSDRYQFTMLRNSVVKKLQKLKQIFSSL